MEVLGQEEALGEVVAMRMAGFQAGRMAEPTMGIEAASLECREETKEEGME